MGFAGIAGRRKRTPGPLNPSYGYCLVRGEAVEQAVAAGRDQIGLGAAARHVGGVPGLLVDRIVEAAPVDVADDGRAVLAAVPIVAGQVDVVRQRAALQV